VRTLIIMAVALSLAAASAADARAATKKVPANFVGAVADGPLLEDPTVSFTGQLNTMVGAGVQSVRIVFNWAAAQPYASFDEVPPDEIANYRDEDGVPTDWRQIDRIVTVNTERRLAILPVVITAPAWAARHPGVFGSPPTSPAQYAVFVKALARRYGPGGLFWTEHPEFGSAGRPIRLWQFWNEPNLKPFWSDQPFATDYVELLRQSREAVKAVDPGAKVVLAGLPNKSWEALTQIYKAGGRGLFDVATFHPFTAKPSGVKTILERDRKVMAKYGDSRMPLWVTELSWTSAKGKTSQKYGNEETESGQAKKLTEAFTLLANLRTKLRIGRVYWYTWLTLDRDATYPFDWAGLLRIASDGKVKRKPAFNAFRKIALKLEQCKSKKGRADKCAT
jgi:polysaccharide biosynthesis protein PslG